MYRYGTKNQRGRSLLEIIAVIAIIGLLALLGGWMYRYAMGKHIADVLYEDLLVRGEALRNRSIATNKKMYDTAIETRARTGATMAFCPDGYGNSTTPCPVMSEKEAVFDVTVFEVKGYACDFLARKDWTSPGQGIVARLQFGEDWYDPYNPPVQNEIGRPKECQNVGEEFNFTVWFWSNQPNRGILPTLCDDAINPSDNPNPCCACQTCRHNICVSDCESTRDGKLNYCIVDGQG